MKGMTLGQYYPADSVLHRMDPRIKILCTIAFIVASFLCVNFFAFILLVASAVALIFLSRIPLKVVLRSVRPLIFIMAFTAVLNIFWVTDPGADPLFHWHFITIYEKGLYHALFILLRIVAMVIGTSLFLTYTTSPIALTDAIERLLYPLAKLHVPVHTFAMMMTIALRFIPTIVDETDRFDVGAEGTRRGFYDRLACQPCQGADSCHCAAVRLGVPAGRRAGDSYGVPLLSRRRGADSSARPPVPCAGLCLAGGCGCPDRRCGDHQH